jgi:4-diphosphocytidyl-2-C-methyl-D-erythritol kinase
MIYFSPAKINLGLQILARREDGFHNLRSVMVPIGLCDILEINQQSGNDAPLLFSRSGLRLEDDPERNLCVRAWKLMAAERDLPGVAIHLHKQIPVGAGLGGGSSNASAVLKALNSLPGTPVPEKRMEDLAARLGSDCPFFLHDVPMLMEGRGEILSRVEFSLKGHYLVVLFPCIHISTAEAYAAVTPSVPPVHLKELIALPVSQWKNSVVNDFEKSAFALHPLLQELKEALYRAGALYASMSGSGSSLYGIFGTPPELPGDLRDLVIWNGPA